jgi:hypothetical protein
MHEAKVDVSSHIVLTHLFDDDDRTASTTQPPSSHQLCE